MLSVVLPALIRPSVLSKWAFTPNYFHSEFHHILKKGLSTRTPYKNRYTHFRKAFPGKSNYVYGVYVCSIFGLLIFFSFGGGNLFADLEFNYVEKRRKQKEFIKKVECQEPDAKDGEENSGQRKTRVGFRDRRFIAYENRIRAYSTPDKIFRYFATLKDDEETCYMTPEDFLRAITPGIKQPEGLDLDRFLRYDPKTNAIRYKNRQMDKLNLHISPQSVFYQLCDKALITFPDFVFLLTVLSTPRRQFEIAFRMFDLNGDGELDSSEFDVVRSVILDTTAMGRRHRDHSTTGSTLRRRPNSALQHYFFGPELDQKLTIKKFLDFHAGLQEEITRLEFERADPVDDKITETQFANFLLTYAGFSSQKKRKLMRGVKQKFPADGENEGISYRDFSGFNTFLRAISDVDTALTFHHMAGAAIDQATLQHVARTVANVELSPHIIDVVFTLFDENNDGQLSYREFVGVMRNRLLRGLDKPMDTGFIRFVHALYTCSKEQIHYVPPKSIVA